MTVLSYLTGKEKKSPRKFFVYISGDGNTLGIRYDNWKVTFMDSVAEAPC
jgi:arylsulfatase